MPDLAGLPVDMAVDRLRQAGICPSIIETRPPRQTLAGEQRVLAVRYRQQQEVHLVVARIAPLPG